MGTTKSEAIFIRSKSRIFEVSRQDLIPKLLYLTHEQKAKKDKDYERTKEVPRMESY